VCSSRYAGPAASYQDNVNRLLQELNGVVEEQRNARFRCVMTLAYDDQKVLSTEGVCSGTILFEPRGVNGFGYDPVFFVPEYRQTFAEMPAAIKNRISHRGLALADMKRLIQYHYQEVFYEK